jgi:hypothetical protein
VAVVGERLRERECVGVGLRTGTGARAGGEVRLRGQSCSNAASAAAFIYARQLPSPQTLLE